MSDQDPEEVRRKSNPLEDFAQITVKHHLGAAQNCEEKGGQERAFRLVPADNCPEARAVLTAGDVMSRAIGDVKGVGAFERTLQGNGQNLSVAGPIVVGGEGSSTGGQL